MLFIFDVQMGPLERQLLWATIGASRRRSQRAAAGPGGGDGGPTPTLRALHDTTSGGLASFLNESGSPDWVSEFR